MQDLTGALHDPDLHSAALAAVYGELERIARAELERHRRGQTLDTRALVHETYLKLFARRLVSFENRKHFFATAAKAMRQIVIDHARSRLAERRGAGSHHLELEVVLEGPLAVAGSFDRLLEIDRALDKLGRLDPRLSQVAEMRFFAGLEVAEIAELLEVSEPTVKRDTRAARAFLLKELSAS